MAADQDAGASGLVVSEQPGAGDLGGGGETRVAVQRAALPRRSNGCCRQHHQQAEAGGREREDKLLAQARVVRVEIPVAVDARELGLARVDLVQQQEEHPRQVDRGACQRERARQREETRRGLARHRPARHRQRGDAHGVAAAPSQRASRCRRGS